MVEPLVNVPREACDIAFVPVLILHRVLDVDLVVTKLEFAHVLHPLLSLTSSLGLKNGVKVTIRICRANFLFVFERGLAVIDENRKHLYK